MQYEQNLNKKPLSCPNERLDMMYTFRCDPLNLLLGCDRIGDSIQSVNHVTAVLPVIGWFCGLETMTPGFLCKW
jgi:hypothetical protein